MCEATRPPTLSCACCRWPQGKVHAWCTSSAIPSSSAFLASMAALGAFLSLAVLPADDVRPEPRPWPRCRGGQVRIASGFASNSAELRHLTISEAGFLVRPPLRARADTGLQHFEAVEEPAQLCPITKRE